MIGVILNLRAVSPIRALALEDWYLKIVHYHKIHTTQQAVMLVFCNRKSIGIKGQSFSSKHGHVTGKHVF